MVGKPVILAFGYQKEYINNKGTPAHNKVTHMNTCTLTHIILSRWTSELIFIVLASEPYQLLQVEQGLIWIWEMQKSPEYDVFLHYNTYATIMSRGLRLFYYVKITWSRRCFCTHGRGALLCWRGYNSDEWAAVSHQPISTYLPGLV